MIICKICGKQCNDRGIGTHVKNQHKIKPIEYYDKFYGKHYCLTCGKETTFRSIHQGYLEFCSIKCADLQRSKFITDNPQKDIDIKQKTKNTLIKKYGVTNSYQIDHIKEKCIANNHTKEALDKRSKSLYKNLKDFCKTNNCITMDEALKINPCVGWWSEVDFIIYKKWRKCISKDNIDIIKNYKPIRNKSKKEEKLYKYICEHYNGKVEQSNRQVIKPLMMTKTIKISEANHKSLSELASKNDTFNDVISFLIKFDNSVSSLLVCVSVSLSYTLFSNK